MTWAEQGAQVDTDGGGALTKAPHVTKTEKDYKLSGEWKQEGNSLYQWKATDVRVEAEAK